MQSFHYLNGSENLAISLDLLISLYLIISPWIEYCISNLMLVNQVNCLQIYIINCSYQINHFPS